MKNVNMQVKGDMLTITVDLTQRHGKSQSGKTMIIASTEGSIKLDGDHNQVAVGLNIYTKDMTEPEPKGGKKGGK